LFHSPIAPDKVFIIEGVYISFVAEQKQTVWIEKAKQQLVATAKLARRLPWLPITAFIAAILAYFFHGQILVFLDLFGKVAAVFLAIAAIFLLAIKIRFREPSLKDKLKRKSVLLEELKIAENKFLQHKISEQDFQEIADRNQKELVELEANISKEMQMLEKQKEELEPLEISSKRRHQLKEFLKKKEIIENEIRIAEAKYLKRKISAPTYREILKGKQQELIKLEAEIKKIYSEESVDKIKKELAEKLEAVEKTEAQKKSDLSEEIVEDLEEQEKKIEKEKT